MQRINQLVSKLAIFLVLFASLAPTVSHALSARNNNNFLQEICSSNGTKKIVIQILTTQGQQLATVLNVKKNLPTNQETAAHHFEHCPFCNTGATYLAIAPASAWVLNLVEQSNEINSDYATPVQSTDIQTAYLTRAPPVL